jgi:maleylacetate reductase
MVSHTLNHKTEEIDMVRRALDGLCGGTFDSMAPHTPRGDVIAATKSAREVGADLIVTVGGGSITDGAKAVTLCLANDIDTVDGIDALRSVARADGTVRPPEDVAAPTIKQITVPTTLSAGEFNPISGVTDDRTQIKELIRHPGITPYAVILDPAVTVHTPEWLWLSTGIRAVDHCVEGTCATEAHAFGDAQALHGLKLLSNGLARVKTNPSDLAARLDCQMGAWLSVAPAVGGVPMGASHGIGYVLGSMFGIPHGQTSCIMLPAVMRWNRQVNAARQARVADVMGHSGEDAGAVLDRFIGGLGMPRSLGAVDIGPEHFQRIAEQAMHTPWVPRNPRLIEGPAQVMEILELAT